MMSVTAPVSTTVMFADICRSTYLFNQLGDEAAAGLVVDMLLTTAPSCAPRETMFCAYAPIR
jgi:class 3 adenylate cyclase